VALERGSFPLKEDGSAGGGRPTQNRIVGGHECQYATAFYSRYRRLYIGSEMVKAVLALADQPRAESYSATAIFEAKRQVWEDQGGYLETIVLTDVWRWLESGSYFIAEVAAPGGSRDDAFLAVAHGVFRVPTSGWIIPLLEGSADEVSDQPRYEAVVSEGWQSSAVVDYWGVLPEWSGKGLAAEARHAGMREVVRRNRTLVREAQVRSVIGLAFAVQGVEVLSGPNGHTVERAVRLADLGQAEVVNRRSLQANTGSHSCPARILGKWRTAPRVPVQIGNARYHLDVEWYCYVHRLDEVIHSS